MAEFKLGRIRFIWKGAWVTSTEYFRDDIIRYGGRTYICISGHTSAVLFVTDEDTKWQKFSDGSEWQSDWNSGAVYKVNDIVKYGGYLYICNTGHTSETPGGKLETDQAKWDLFSEGFDWKDIWETSTHYKVNDIVKYGGTLYLCTVPHTSSGTFQSDEDGLEADSDKWDIFAQGQDWKTDWVQATRYKKHDEVKYGGQLYICNEGHISGSTVEGLEADQTKWDYLHKGIEYKSVHAGTTRYKVNDVVKSGGGLWICNNYHTSTTTLAADVTVSGSVATIGTISGPDATRTAGTYNDVKGTTSGSGDVANTRFNIVIDGAGAATSVTVVHGGTGHVATDVISIPNTQIGGSGATLTFNVASIENTTQWYEFVAGLEFEDSWSGATSYQPGDFVTYGGYSYISKTNNTNILPFGNAGDWDLFTTGFNLQGDYNNGTAYKVGDVIRLGGYTYLAKANTTGNRPPNLTYWERLNQGIEWKDAWADATLYDAGDAVRGIGNVNSYICILAHTSDEISVQNRPDQDVAGTYWQLLSGGVESGNLTTVGDLVYYGGSGPVRLPIGTPGQVLKVNAAGDAPEWAYFGSVDGVYYVSPNGTDGVAPVDGITLDKPWRSVRYALNEIRKGPRNPDGANLLKRNKAFLMEEAGIQYVAWKIANNSAPFSTGYTHDAAKCSRDMGIIIDGFLYDIGHGDNRRSVANALSFFSLAGASYIEGQALQNVDVINYMVSVIDTTLRNLAPATNYQTTNGIAGGSQVIQKIDATKNVEAGVYARIQELAAIITDAISAGSISTIPPEAFAYNTLFVKTGIYKETLPMIVPEGTAVIGDELRSTEINALGSEDSVTTLEHTTLTLNGLLHIKSIIDNICVNGAITKTPAGAHLTMDSFSGADALRTAGTYTGVTGTSSGTGTVGTFDIVVDGSGAVTSITVITAGHGHVINNTITIDDANLGGGAAANFTMDVATIAAGNTLTQDVALPAGTATAGTRAQELFQDIHDKINNEVFGVGTAPETTGKTGRDSTQGYVDARLRIFENLDFIAEEVVAYLQTTYTSKYDFTKDAKCKSDMKAYLDAVIHDLENYGNYKSILYGRWSSNAVKGSKHEDMYYCQNATGVRNQTVQGLKGTFYRASATTAIQHGKEEGDIIELRDINVNCSLANKIYPLVNSLHTPTAATYSPSTGLMELTIGQHGYRANQYVSIATDSLTFSCTFDNNATNHTYPRATGSSHPGGADPAYNTPVEITTVGGTTITVDVGTGSADSHSVSAATYTPATGVMELTIGSHQYETGKFIKIATDSLTFTCALDSHATNHTYPRATGSSASYSVSAATYTPATGVMELTIGSHQYETGKFVNIAMDSLTFTCALDSHATNHTYPRASGSSAPGGYDYAYNTPVEITSKTATTITINVGISSNTSAHTFVSATADCITNPGSVVDTPTAATYDAATGLMTLTIGSHGYKVGHYVNIATDSLTFTCTFDNNATNHTYPRASGSSYAGGADPAYNISVPITAVGATTITMNVGTGSADTHSVSAATYTPTTGVMELTIGSHTLVTGNYVDLATDSLTFTCTFDNNATNHTYPRASGSAASYSVSAATYTPATGVMELTIGSHQYETGKFIKIATDSLTFTCALDSHATNHTYPRATGSSAPGGADYAYDTPVEITGVTATTITMNVGISSDTSVHTFVSATADCITNPGGADYVHNTPIAITGVTATTITMNVGTGNITSYTPSAATYTPATGVMELTIGSHTLVAGNYVDLATDSLTFTCALDSHATNHTYPRASGSAAPGGADYAYATPVEITGVTATTITMNVGVSSDTSAHTFVSATADCVTNSTAHTFVSATADCVANSTAHTFVSATAGAITGGGDYVHNTPIAITGVTATTITMNVGVSSDLSAHTFVSATADCVTNSMAHTFISATADCISSEETTFKMLASNATATTFDVDLGTSTIAQTYVKGGVAIPQTGTQEGNRLDIRNFDYDTGTGIATITTMGGATVQAINHGKSYGDLIEIDSVLMSCAQGNKTYPVNTFSTAHSTAQQFTVLASGLTATEFEIDIGTSTTATTYVSGGTVVKTGNVRLTITGFAYDIGTGIATVTTGTHSLSASDNVQIRGVVMTCAHGTKVYPAIPHAGIYPVTSVPDDDTLDFFLPPSAIAHTYVSGGTVKSVTISNVGSSTGITNLVYVNDTGLATVTSATHGLAVGDRVKISSVTLSCSTGNKVYPDANVSSGVFYVYDVPDGNTFIFGMDRSDVALTYVSGGSAQKVTPNLTNTVNITSFVFDTHSGHGLVATNLVKLRGIETTCSYGSKIYPQMPFSGTFPITRKVSDTEFNFFLPDSNIDHTYVSGGTVKTVTVTNVGNSTNITAFDYNNTTGYTTVDSTAHGLAVNDYVRIQSVKVSCTQGEKVYPDAHSSSAIFVVYDVLGPNRFVYAMDKSTFVHTYVSGGIVQKITYTATDSKPISAFRYEPKGLVNEYGTKRPNSGAFLSLDPSWGPNDNEAFIHLKSPYIQNVTTIGEKCVGCKIDGDLHAGGLDSFVCNDFTQIVDEGISIWCTNLGRVELVSVFTYYGHIGYFAENGGKIRATNGNNSYGDFGSVAEGIDLTEEAIIAYVDNRSYQAVIGNVIVNNNSIIAIEYTNCGRDYVSANTSYTFTGDGYGITGATAVTVTGGVSQVRLLGTSSTFGGADYITATNTIQAGTDTQITLSNTDTAISSAYLGMAIVLTSGKGAGQIAYIDTYDAATKVATVLKPNDDTAGWNHMTGATIETLLDNTTTYSIEPRVTITAPSGDGSTATGTAKGRAKVVDGKIIEVRLYDPGASYITKPTVTFTDPNNTAEALYEVYLGDGALTQPTFTDPGTGWTSVSATVLDVGVTKNITGVTYTANPFAVSLLEGNKEYIKDEVTAWIDNQIAGGTNPSLWLNFVHDKVKCERDIGFLIDAFVHDLKYGSNRDTVTAARRYWIGSTFVGGETTQIIAAYEQMRIIILDYILDNTLYASLQTVTTQITYGNNGEAGAQTRCAELISIITHVVAHGLAVIPESGGEGYVDITVTGHNILSQTKVKVDGIVGTHQLNNNTFYVNVVDVDTLRLYIDENLLHPAVGDNFTTYISDGTIVHGAGYRDEKQNGKYLQVESMLAIPQSGANIEFATVPNTWFKLVSVTNLTGSNPYSALLQLSPDLTIPQAPLHGEKVTIRIRYSQVRLTGHDFLHVGTGNFVSTNYPGQPAVLTDQLDEAVDSGGGRVFLTSTDQSGNFRVGDLFTVEQATGIATLNADAFSISGLQELQLGSVELGTAGATINEFSTDGTFTANSDQIVPTQRAIKTFITSQIGGGASELNVNSVTAGIINIQGNTITTTTGARINTTATMHFSAGVSGAPVAMQQFLLS